MENYVLKAYGVVVGPSDNILQIHGDEDLTVEAMKQM